MFSSCVWFSALDFVVIHGLSCLSTPVIGGGGGEQETTGMVLVGVGCNPGRSFITLGLPFLVFASEAAHSWGKFIDLGLKYNFL